MMHHLTELFTNTWIMIPLFILFFGEYIPFARSLWQKIGLTIKAFGEWFLDTYEKRLYHDKEAWIEKKRIHLKLNNLFARTLFFILSVFIVFLLEIVWELGFKNITIVLEHSKIAQWSENKIKQMPSWAVLILFGAPFILMETIGIFAMERFVSGYFWTGIGLYLFRLLFFFPVHFILHIGKMQLLAIPWFKRRYEIVTTTLGWFKRSQTSIKIHNFFETIKAYFSVLKNRFAQNIILLKKVFKQEEILSLECETVRQEILAAQKEGRDDETLFKKFFNCVDTHLRNKIDQNTKESHEKH